MQEETTMSSNKADESSPVAMEESKETPKSDLKMASTSDKECDLCESEDKDKSQIIQMGGCKCKVHLDCLFKRGPSGHCLTCSQELPTEDIALINEAFEQKLKS